MRDVKAVQFAQRISVSNSKTTPWYFSWWLNYVSSVNRSNDWLSRRWLHDEHITRWWHITVWRCRHHDEVITLNFFNNLNKRRHCYGTCVARWVCVLVRHSSTIAQHPTKISFAVSWAQSKKLKRLPLHKIFSTIVNFLASVEKTMVEMVVIGCLNSPPHECPFPSGPKSF